MADEKRSYQWPTFVIIGKAHEDDDLERNRLGCDLGYVCLRDLEFHDVTGRDAIRGIGGVAVDPHEVTLDQARGGRPAQVLRLLGEKAVQPRRRGGCNQAGAFRNRLPAIRRTTPMLIAESATLKTGQKWTFTKSVTNP